MSDRKVQGCCPMGCGETLFLGDSGHVTCASTACPRPDAVTVILATAQTGHTAAFKDGHWNVIHPLRERLDNALLTCGYDPGQYHHYTRGTKR